MKIKNIVLAAILILLTACTDKPKAKKILEANGYTNIQFSGYGWMDCGDDAFSTEFSAVNIATGRRVEGVVCSNWWGKNATIRFE